MNLPEDASRLYPLFLACVGSWTASMIDRELALRGRVEQQQLLLEAQYRLWARTQGREPVIVRRRLSPPPGRLGHPQPEPQGPPQSWPDDPMHSPGMTLPPGFACSTIPAERVSAVLVSLLGLPLEELAAKIEFIEDLQRRTRNFTPLFLSDVGDQSEIALRGYVAEYLSPSSYRSGSGQIRPSVIQRKVRRLARKWNLRDIIDLSHPSLRPAVSGAFTAVKHERLSLVERPDPALWRYLEHPLSAAPLGTHPPGGDRLRSFLDYEWGPELASEIVELTDWARQGHGPAGGPAPIEDRELSKRLKLIAGHAQAVPYSDEPILSIVIPVYNQIRYTLACLQSIFRFPPSIAFEVLIGDDASTDATNKLGGTRIRHLRVIRHEGNLGFLRNCNATARVARGRYLSLLNNDVVALPGAIQALVETLGQGWNAGLVGGRLLSPDGTLQEAGAFVFSNGAGWNYGRGGDPLAPAFNFVRETDYCSAAAIAFPRRLWDQLGGFDERYAPAYYEDTDLAFRLRRANRRVVYQPRAVFIHFEGISHGKEAGDGLKRFQVANRHKFSTKWRSVISQYGSEASERLPIDRFNKRTILIVDAEVPRTDNDSGSADAFEQMRVFRELGYGVIFVPLNLARPEPYATALQDIGVEVLVSPYFKSLESAVASVSSRIDVSVLSRAMVAREAFPLVQALAPSVKIVFNPVDLHFLRLGREADLTGNVHARNAAESLRKIEIGLVRRSDATIVVSAYEAELLRREAPGRKIVEVPIMRRAPPEGRAAYSSRRDVLFIGGFRHPPNWDAVQYFITTVWPLLRSGGFTGRFIVAGSNMPPSLQRMKVAGVEFRGFVPDLRTLLNECRLMVAPLRYGAGAKGKVVTSLSYGVPIVATSVAVEGMSVNPGDDIVVADDPSNMAAAILSVYRDPTVWNRLSRNGQALFERKYSVEANAPLLDTLVEDLVRHTAVRHMPATASA